MKAPTIYKCEECGKEVKDKFTGGWIHFDKGTVGASTIEIYVSEGRSSNRAPITRKVFKNTAADMYFCSVECLCKLIMEAK